MVPMTEKTPPPQVWPTFAAHDARAMITFLTGVLGFVEVVSYAGDDGVVQHAELAWPAGGGVMTGQQRPDAGGRATPPGAFTAYVVVPDAAEVDALAERIRAADGAEVLEGPYDTGYGSHDVAVRDPEGNRWQFGTYPGAPRP